MTKPSRRALRASGASKAIVPVLLIALAGLTLILRTWSLNKVPPWLWWDEATQGLDARDLLHGHFEVFFPRAQGKEPLYIYLTAPFVAAWDGQPFAVRLAGALTGSLMVPALFAAGRALWRHDPTRGAWMGLAAAGFWTTNFWPQSINRIGFQVNALPLMLTLAIVAWLNWTHRPGPRRAFFFGLLAGLSLATYLAARVTPLLWLLLFLALPACRRRLLRPGLKWALAGFCLVAVPLLVYFVCQPQVAFERVSMFANLYQAPTLRDQALLLLDNVRQVAGGFLGFTGDPIPRHNIPNRPPFSPALGALFALGFVVALLDLRRRSERSTTLLLWWGLLALPAVLSANSNPHFPRLLGALPAAFLLAAWPVSWLAGRLRAPAGAALAALLALFLVVEGAQTVQAYFVTWPEQTDLYTWYQGDVWGLGEKAATEHDGLVVVPLDPDSADGLDYAFSNAPIRHVQVDEASIGVWLDAELGAAAGTRVAVPVWSEEPYVYADPQELLPYYLKREGTLETEQPQRGYNLLTFTVGDHPQFSAQGRQASLDDSFGPDLSLVGVSWGAAYPNPDRGAATVAAGTPVWTILTWRLAQPDTSLRVAVDLVDRAGHRLAAAEQPLLDDHLSTSPWPAGRLVRTYHLVTVPATQPAGPVALEARVYDEKTFVPVQPANGTPRLSVPLAGPVVALPLAPVDASKLQLAHPMQVTARDGVTLLGLDGWPETVAPGDLLTLRLFWRADADLASARTYRLALGDTGVVTDVSLEAGPAGRVMHAYADLRLPADTAPGTYPLLLEMAGLPAGEAPLHLGDVDVSGRPRQFAPPALSQTAQARFGDAVSLLGLAGAPAMLQAAPGRSITLTLVWRAERTPSHDLVRFVHVPGPGGRPLAQQDGPPCEGDCPAPSWLPGEILTDRVKIDLPADLPPGIYSLAAGWFDPATSGQPRLPVRSATGEEPAGDLLTLPVQLRVTP